MRWALIVALAALMILGCGPIYPAHAEPPDRSPTATFELMPNPEQLGMGKLGIQEISCDSRPDAPETEVAWYEDAGWTGTRFAHAYAFFLPIGSEAQQANPYVVVIIDDPEGVSYSVYIDFDRDGYVDQKFLHAQQSVVDCGELLDAVLEEAD